MTPPNSVAVQISRKFLPPKNGQKYHFGHEGFFFQGVGFHPFRYGVWPAQYFRVEGGWLRGGGSGGYVSNGTSVGLCPGKRPPSELSLPVNTMHTLHIAGPHRFPRTRHWRLHRGAGGGLQRCAGGDVGEGGADGGLCGAPHLRHRVRQQGLLQHQPAAGGARTMPLLCVYGAKIQSAQSNFHWATYAA